MDSVDRAHREQEAAVCPRLALRVSEAAEALGISTRTAWKLIAGGHLRAVKLSPGTTRVEPAELERFLRAARDRG